MQVEVAVADGRHGADRPPAAVPRGDLFALDRCERRATIERRQHLHKRRKLEAFARPEVAGDLRQAQQSDESRQPQQSRGLEAGRDNWRCALSRWQAYAASHENRGKVGETTSR